MFVENADHYYTKAPISVAPDVGHLLKWLMRLCRVENLWSLRGMQAERAGVLDERPEGRGLDSVYDSLKGALVVHINPVSFEVSCQEFFLKGMAAQKLTELLASALGEPRTPRSSIHGRDGSETSSICEPQGAWK